MLTAWQWLMQSTKDFLRGALDKDNCFVKALLVRKIRRFFSSIFRKIHYAIAMTLESPRTALALVNAIAPRCSLGSGVPLEVARQHKRRHI